MRIKIICQCNLNVETEGKINLLVTLIQWFVTQRKLSLIFAKTLLLPHKRASLLNDSHDSYKSADGNSKLHITRVISF